MNDKLQYKLLACFIIAIFWLQSEVAAQDIQFTQFYASPTILAPSFAGMTGGSRVALNYRDQWPSLPGTFVTYGLAFDHYFPRMRSGFGLLVLRDQAGEGPLSLTNVGLVYSYDFQINKDWHIRPGVNFNYNQRGLKFSELTMGDQVVLGGPNAQTSIEVPPLDHVNYIDAYASVLAYSDQYWGGFSVEHLMRPNESLSAGEATKGLKVSVFGGMKINLAPRSSRIEEGILLAFNYKAKENSDQLDLGVYYNKNPLVIGAWFRGIPVLMDKTGNKYENIDAVAFLIGYKLTNLHIGYSYDFTISELMDHSGGSHEISVIYEFNQNLKLRRRHKYGAISCPNF